MRNCKTSTINTCFGYPTQTNNTFNDVLNEKQGGFKNKFCKGEKKEGYIYFALIRII